MARQLAVDRGAMTIRFRALVGVLCFSTTAVVGSGVVASASASVAPTAYRASIVAGRPGVVDGGSARDSNIKSGDVAVSPSGDVYLADGGHVDKIGSDGTLTVVAGVVGFSPPAGVTNIVPVPGPARDSPMDPSGLALDSAGNLYIADGLGFIDKVTPDGTLSIVAGIGKAQVYDGPRPGPATSSPVVPGGIVVDPSGNLLFTNWPGEILKVTPDGTLSIAATLSQFMSSTPNGWNLADLGSLALDSTGNLYVTAINPTRTSGYVFKMTPGGVVSVVAGDNAPGTTNTPGSATGTSIIPNGVAVDPIGDVYVTTSASYGSGQIGQVLKVKPDGSMSIVAGSLGTGTAKAPYPPVPGPATSSPMNPVAITLDSSGSLYISDVGFSGDYSAFVEKVTPDGTLSVLAGTTTNSPTPGPAKASPMNASDVAVDSSGDLYLADAGYIEKITPDGTLSFFAGNGDTSDPPVPGAARSSPMDPGSVAVSSSGDVYVTDGRGYVLKITPAGELSILIGPGAYAAPFSSYSLPTYPNEPSGIAVDSADNVYVADFIGYVEKLTPSGAFSIVAGEGSDGPAGPPIGPTATSTLIIPTGVAVDTAGNIYIPAGCYADKIAPDGSISMVGGSSTSSCSSSTDVAVDAAGNVYVSEDQGSVERIAPDGTVSTIAGTPSTQPPTDTGWATAMIFNPDPITVDSSGDVYVANWGWPNSAIVKLTPAPATKPSAPTNVSATPGNRSAKISFTPSLDTGGVPITGYTASDGVGDTCSPSPLTVYGTGNMSCTVTGLAPGASYTFTVTATNGVGTSEPSASSNTVVPFTFAGPPTEVTATAGAASASISWTAPAFDGWSPVAAYTVAATDTTSGTPPYRVCLNSWTTNATSCTATGLTNGDHYTFTVSAVNAAGIGPASSPSPTVTPQAPPDAPNSTMITAGDRSVTPIWYSPSDNGSPITSYTATAQPGGATCTTPGGGTPNWCTITGLANGVTYSVSVTATNAVGTSPPGETVSATPQASPPTITNTATPTIGGTARVGSRLTASVGTWSASSLSYQYQWFANGAVISGATASGFTPASAQLGKTLTVLVTASRSGYNTGSAMSAVTPLVARGIITNKTLPTINGTKRVGYTLTANVGTWSPSGLIYHYQWFRGTTAIRGAIYRTYKLAASMHGYRIRVRVTASRTGYTSLARYSSYTVAIR